VCCVLLICLGGGTRPSMRCPRWAPCCRPTHSSIVRRDRPAHSYITAATTAPRVIGILALRAPTELPMSCLARSAQPAELPSLGTTRQALCRRWGTWDYTPMQQHVPTDTPVSLSSTHSFDPCALPPPFTLLVLREVICMNYATVRHLCASV